MKQEFKEALIGLCKKEIKMNEDVIYDTKDVEEKRVWTDENKFLGEIISELEKEEIEIEFTLQRYTPFRLCDEEQKAFDDMIDCQIEELKIKRDTKDERNFV
jgi:hypothetical protein